MALVRTHISMADVPDWETLAKDLNSRTGLTWSIHGSGLSSDGAWSQCTLEVARFKWEIDVARRVDSNVIEVELMPLRWPAVNYHYWQVLAALHARGGTRISGNGQVRTIKFPRWISRRWDEMPWWCRYQG